MVYQCIEELLCREDKVQDIFKGLMRAVTPHLKEGLKKVGKKALKTGMEVITDISNGGNVKGSLKRRAKENIGELFNIPNKMSKSSRSTPIRRKTLKGKGRKKKTNNSLGIL